MNRKHLLLLAAAAVLLALACSCDMGQEKSAISDFSKSDVMDKTQQAPMNDSVDFRDNAVATNNKINPFAVLGSDSRFVMSSTGKPAFRVLESRSLERQTPRRRSDAAAAAPKVLFDLSHNPVSDGTPLSTYYSDFISTFELNGFEVSILADFANLLEYDVVVEVLPQSPFTTAEVTLTENYLNAGKIFLLFGEYWLSSVSWTNTYVDALLADLTAGVRIVDAVVYEPQIGNYYLNEYWLLIHDFSGHCLNDGITELLHPAAGYLDCDNPDQILYRSSPSSYLSDTPSQHGPFPMAAIPDPATHPGWKMFVTADTNLFSTSYDLNSFNFQGNADFAVNLMFWCQGSTTSTYTSTSTSTTTTTTTATSTSTSTQPTTTTTPATTSSTTTSTAAPDDEIISSPTPVPDVPIGDKGNDEEWPKGKITGGCCGS